MTSFLNFRLIVNKVADDDSGQYYAAVTEAPVDCYFVPFVKLGTIERLVKAMPSEVTVNRKGGFHLLGNINGERGKGSMLSGPQLAGIGNPLFRFLFPETSRHLELFRASCQRANQLNADLQLQLEVHQDLANLPWELSLCPENDPYAADILHAHISISRYLGNINSPEGSTDNKSYEGNKASAVVIVKSDPENFSNMNVTTSLNCERDRIATIFDELGLEYRFVDAERGRKSANYSTSHLLAQTIDELEESGKSVVGLHMIGHGGIDDYGSYFVGEDSDFCPQYIYGNDLRSALDRARSLRWAIINACNCGDHPAGVPLGGLATSVAVLKRVPTVVAYTRPVDTNFAEELAAEFYSSILVRRRPITGTVRKIQTRNKSLNGLVLLQSSLNGRICEHIMLNKATSPYNGNGFTRAQRSDNDTTSVSDIIEHSCEWDINRQSTQRRKDKKEGFEETGAQQRAEVDTGYSPPGFGEMVLVEGGSYQTGLSSGQVENIINQFKNLPIEISSLRKLLSEKPAAEIEVPAFYMDCYPVTNEQFEKFVKQTGYRTTAEDTNDPENWRNAFGRDKEHHPVVCVSFRDAATYAEWAGKRLPTANEWLKAFRGPEGRLYPWGDNYDIAKCNTAESCRGSNTTEVNRFPNGVSPYGCFDMVGNVEEFTTTKDDRGNHYVFGGSWEMTCQVYGLPVLKRLASDTFYSRDLGFRCIKNET